MSCGSSSNPILLEAGPGRTLGVLAMQHPDRGQAKAPVVISSLRHSYENESDTEFMLRSIGRIWLAGTGINWDNLCRGKRQRRICLPSYPFEREDYWITNRDSHSAQRFPSSSAGPEQSGIDNWFYVPTWERVPFVGDINAAVAKNRCAWLIFSDRWGGNRVQEKLTELGVAAYLVEFADAFHRRNHRSFQISPTTLDDYLKLFQELKEDLGDSLNIVHLGCLTADNGPSNRSAADRDQDFGFFSLLHIAQTIGELGISIPVRIGIISNRIHDVTGEEKLDPDMAPVLGASGVIPKEFRNLTCFNVDLSGPQVAEDLPDDVIVKILSEFAADKNETVAYRGSHRWRIKYEQLSLPVAPVSNGTAGIPELKRLRKRGVYLITGGTGGLGLTFAKYLAKACQARIVLTKKAAFPEKSTWKELLNSKETPEAVVNTINELLEIERLGGEVEVFVAEVSDKDQMRRAVNETLRKFQTINGVFHAAGIVRAGLIQAKTKEIAASVLSPKVAGTKVLFDLIRDKPVDFLVLFSSISSITTPYAHSDYSAANWFLDAFASYANSQTKFHTLTINWPVWKEVGIVAKLESLLGAEALKEQALEKAILTKDGLDAFTRALNSDHQQIIVSPEDLDRLIGQNRGPHSIDRSISRRSEGGNKSPIQARSRKDRASQPTNEVESGRS